MQDWFDHKFYNEITKHILHERYLSRFLQGSHSPSSDVLRIARKNLEVHFSDPRQLYDEEDKDDVKYKADIIIDFLDRAIKSKNTLEYLKTLHKHLFPSVSFKEMMLTIKTILTEPLGYNKAFWNSELFDKYSRTKRQIKKLPLPIQNILQDYIIEKYTSFTIVIVVLIYFLIKLLVLICLIIFYLYFKCH